MKRKGKISTEGYRSDSPDRFNDFNIIPSSYIDMTGVNHDVLMIPMGGHTVGNPVLAKPGERYFFPRHDFVFEQAMPEDAMMRYQRLMQEGGVNTSEDYNMQRALELGYTSDETGHWPSVDSETLMWLKSKKHPTAWMEYMQGQLNPELAEQYTVRVNPEGYFGEDQLQYIPKQAYGGNLPKAQEGIINLPEVEVATGIPDRILQQSNIIKKTKPTKNYAITDKKNNVIYYFKPTGELIANEPVITGRSNKDLDTGLSMKDWFQQTGSKDHDAYFKYLAENQAQTTPAGIYNISGLRENVADNPDMLGRFINLFRPERREKILSDRLRDYGNQQKLFTLKSEYGVPSSKAVHGTGNPKRMVALDTPGSNRDMSNGCVNVGGKTVCFDVLEKGSPFYILPEENNELLEPAKQIYNTDLKGINVKNVLGTKKKIQDSLKASNIPYTEDELNFLTAVAEKETKGGRSISAKLEDYLPHMLAKSQGTFQINPETFQQYLPENYTDNFNDQVKALHNFYSKNAKNESGYINPDELYQKYSGDTRGIYSDKFNKLYLASMSGYKQGGSLPYAQVGLTAASTYASGKEQNTKESMSNKERIYQQALADIMAEKELKDAQLAMNLAGTVFYPASVAASIVNFSQDDYGQGLAGLVPFVGPASKANIARQLLNQGSRNLLTKSVNAGIPYKVAAPIIKAGKNATMYGANATNAYDAYDALNQKAHGGLHKAKDGYQLAQERLMKSFQPESSSLFTTSAPVEFPTYQNLPYYPSNNNPSWEDIMSAWQQQERRQYPLDPGWGVYPKRTGPGPIRWPITPTRNTGIPWPSFERPNSYADYKPKHGWSRSGMTDEEKAYEEEYFNNYYYPKHAGEKMPSPPTIINLPYRPDERSNMTFQEMIQEWARAEREATNPNNRREGNPYMLLGYGGVNINKKRLPNRRETNKNIKSSINYLMRRNETLFGPRGKNFYNPNPMSKYYKGGIAFPPQPTADTFYKQGWIPPGPVGFYEHGGIAYPQLPTEDYFFSGSPWMPTYGMGGLPGGANEMSMPCMECGGYMEPGGTFKWPSFKTASEFDKFITKDPNLSLYTASDLEALGLVRPAAPDAKVVQKQKEQKGQYTPATGGGYTKIGSNPNELYDYVVGQGYQPRPVQQMVNAIPPQKYGGNLNMAQDGRIVDWAKQQQQKLAERTGQGIPSGVSKYYGAFDVPNLSKMDSVVTSPINPNIGMAFKGSKSMLVPLDKSAEQDVRKINKPFTVATPSGRGEREVFVNYQEEGGFMSPDNMMDYPMFYTGGYPMMYADGGNIMDYDQDQMIKNLGNSFMSGIQQNIENDAFNKASQNLYENMMPIAQYGYSQNPQNMLNMGMAQQMLADMNNNPSNLISSLGALGDTAGTYTKYKIKKGKKYEIPAGDIAASSAPANQNMATARYGTAYIPKAQGGLNNAIPQGSLLNPQTLRNEMFKLPAKTQSSVEMSPELEAKKKAFYDAASAYDQRWNAYNQQARGQGQGYRNQGSYAPGYQSIYDMYGNQDYRVGRMSRSMKDLLPYIMYNPQNTFLKEYEAKKALFGPGARKVKMTFTTVFDPRTGQQVQVPTTSAQQQEDPNLARYNKDLAEGLAETRDDGGKNWFERFKDKRAARKASKESNAPASKSPFVEGRPGRLFGPEENPMTPYGTIPTGTTSAQNMSYAPASQPNFLDSYPSINNFDYNAMMNNMNMSADYAPTNTGNFAPMGMRYEYGGDYEMGVPVELTEDQINQIMAAGGQITYID